MQWNIPGTLLKGQREDAEKIPQQFRAMFLPGGMMLSQVSSITGLEPYTVQNWVKRGFLSAPEKKRYSLSQLCRIMNINMLKGVLSMERICSLLGYVNGQLDDDSDDMINDSDLYFMFVGLAARAPDLPGNREELLDDVMAGYQETVPGARNRVRQVLRVMLTAWIAARIGQEAETMLTDLLENHQM